MKKDIRFSLVYRDMWQSSGKYVPTAAQLKEVAPAIIDMGCFDRVETNGGAFEQVNLLFGENPNKAVREWTAPFRKAGIQTHMLERGLNALRMNPVPADVRELITRLNQELGLTVIVSSHILSELQNTAHRFGIIHGGTMAQVITRDDLVSEQKSVKIKVDDLDRAREALNQAGVTILSETNETRSLEDFYFGLVGGNE